MQTIEYAIKDLMRTLKTRQESGLSVSPERLLGAALSKKDLKHVRVSYFKKGILGVKVDSTARLYLLSLRKENLLEALRKNLSGLKDIRFSLGVRA